MAGEWPDDYLEFQLTSSQCQHEEREHQCTPVPHTLNWRDFSRMLQSLYIPDWLKKEAEKENLSITESGSMMTGVKTKNCFWGSGSGRAQALKRKRVAQERPGATAPPHSEKGMEREDIVDDRLANNVAAEDVISWVTRGKTVLLNNLPMDITEKELLSLASECGIVEDCLMETVGDITYCYMRMSDRDSCANFISELEGSYKDRLLERPVIL